MPSWLAVVLGVVGGVMLIAGAIYLAVRPYLRPGHEPWMVDHKDSGTLTYEVTTIPDTGVGNGG